ncbi:GGDEF domain-containing protein [Marinobacterium weihaiense]|uniref:diguanylate cyclase n=1 Tax=Marinobacterium weihaiense TaxID=2851016 RepID=A0ABS6MDJ3_9GAMM|nr:diguanylate cyclase [Marinobacterium weihaiense]MBV0934364.1 diguanylate cyclase [Marinobacterium weihaiense]
MNTTPSTPAPTLLTGQLKLTAMLHGRDPMLMRLILLMWLTSTGLSVLLGVAAVELNWSAMPFEFSGHRFHVTLYPPLILGMFWLFWFGFWWAAIPTWSSTFVLAVYYGMPVEWAMLFACSDPLGLALIAMIYRSLPESMQIRHLGNIALFALISFAAAVLSSVGAFIWSHATQAHVTDLYLIWEGWWLGFWLQNLVLVLPLLLLFDPTMRRWQHRTGFWVARRYSENALRQTLVVALVLVSTALLFTWFSAHLTERAIMVAAYSRDAQIWQPMAQLVRDSVNALMTVLVILIAAMSLFGIYLFRYWSARLKQSHQMLIRTNRTLSSEISEREKVQTELQQRYHMLNLMAQLDARLHAARCSQDIIDALSEYLPQQLPQVEGVLCRVDDQHQLDILLHWGRFPLIGSHHAARIQLPDDPSAWSRVNVYDPSGSHDIHRALPLRSDNNLLGVILLGRSPQGDTAVDAVLQILTEHLSLALTNLSLREQLMEEATRDPLTGLYNRRYLHNRLEQELARSRRHQRPLSLMMIDIDHFKRLNDSLGHEAGDQALRGMARHMAEHVRESDVACRYGGEEIILILPEADRDAAEAYAQRLLEGIRALRLTTRQGTDMPRLTVSIGLAVFPEDADTGDSLIQAADRAMYRAKKDGRNRVCVKGR